MEEFAFHVASYWRELVCVHVCVCVREREKEKEGVREELFRRVSDDRETSFLYLLFIQVCHLCFYRKL